MIEALRHRLALLALRAAVAARTPHALPPVARRSLLVVLPADEADQRAAWALVDDVALPDRQVHPVVVSDRIAYQPDRFAGAVRTLGPDELDWRGLPSPAARQRIWASRPDVALSLAAPGDLASALLVGGSPAAVRVGTHVPGLEACYDLMVQGEPSVEAAVAALGRLLRQLTPPVLPIR